MVVGLITYLSVICLFSIFLGFTIYWTYRHLDKLKDTWSKSEILSLGFFGLMLASTFTFVTLLIITFVLSIFELEVSVALSNLLKVFLFGQLIFLLSYPLYEFPYFAQEGTQATENYHKRLETVTEWIGNITTKLKLPKYFAGLILYGIEIGGIFLISFVLNALGYPTEMFTILLTVFLFYPAVILGYYGARGLWDSLQDLLYLRQYRNLAGWIALFAFLTASYGFIALITGRSFLPTIRTPFSDRINSSIDSITMPNWIQPLFNLVKEFFPLVLLLFALAISLYFTISGFREDYLAVKPLTRMYDYLFTGFLLSGISFILFLTLLENHIPLQSLFTWIGLQPDSILITSISNIEEQLIFLIVVFYLYKAKFTPKREQITKFFQKFITSNIGQLTRSKKYDVNVSDAFATILTYGGGEDQEASSKITPIENLDLRNCGLTQIPEQVFGLKTMHTLNLATNKLVKIPQEINNLKLTLKIFDLSENMLTELPESFGALTALTELRLRHNELKALPNSFGNLLNLQILSLSLNPLGSLSKELCHLASLKELELESALLDAIPNLFGQLQALQILNLSNNRLTELPNSFGNLKALVDLNLSENFQLQSGSLPLSFYGLSRLQSLNLAANFFKIIPESFKKFQSLEKLILKQNPLAPLEQQLEDSSEPPPVSFKEFMSLKILDLSSTPLNDLPESFKELTNLKTLDLSGTPLSKDQNLADARERIKADLKNCYIKWG